LPHDVWNVYYCTNFGDPEGTLTVNDNCLRFSPSSLSLVAKSEESLEDALNSEKRSKVLEVVLDIDDIAECNMMAVPSLLCEDHFNAHHEFEKDYLIQILLNTHGTRSMGKYLDGVFKELKEKKTPYACIYFKLKNVTDTMQEFTNDQKHHMLQEIQARIMAAKHARQLNGGKKEVTKIPHFEFLSDRFDKNDAELIRKVAKSALWNDPDLINALGNARKFSSSSIEEESKGGDHRGLTPIKGKRMVIPTVTDHSNILTMQQFTEIVNSVPELYQMLEWRLAYSNIVHGTSYGNLLRKAEKAEPFVLVIQDDSKFVFGVYGNQKLKYSTDYYGSGETFLFSFRDLEEISVFSWTKNNNKLFMHTDEQGLTFGASPNYGLWISSELTYGRSFPCETFKNPRLSDKSDFHLQRIELWTIKDPTQS